MNTPQYTNAYLQRVVSWKTHLTRFQRRMNDSSLLQYRNSRHVPFSRRKLLNVLPQFGDDGRPGEQKWFVDVNVEPRYYELFITEYCSFHYFSLSSYVFKSLVHLTVLTRFRYHIYNQSHITLISNIQGMKLKNLQWPVTRAMF
jgi:hypothetical protein